MSFFFGLVLAGGRVHGQEGAGDALPIKFAGVWLSGKFSDAQRDFPVGSNYALRIADGESDKRAVELSRRMLAALRKVSRPGGKRIVDALAPDDYTADASAGRGLVLACSINSEFAEAADAGGVKRVFAQVGFDVLVCDFTAPRKVVFVLPRACMLIKLANEVKSAEGLVEEIYSGKGAADADLVATFVSALKNAQLPMAGMMSLGVSKVEVRDEARAVLPEKFRDQADAYLGQVAVASLSEGLSIDAGRKDREAARRARLKAGQEGAGGKGPANVAGGEVAARFDVPPLGLMPYSRGNGMVFCGMREGLSDAVRLQIQSEQESAGGVRFVLPKPDYEVELLFPAFRTTKQTTNAVGAVVAHASYCRVTVKRGDAVIYSSQHMDHVESIWANRGKDPKVPWLSYSDAADSMFVKAGGEMLKAAFRPAVDQKEPMRVTQPAALQEMLADCAPLLAKALADGDEKRGGAKAPGDSAPKPAASKSSKSKK